MRPTLLLASLALLVSFSRNSLAEDNAKPFGLQTRSAWTTSQVVGTPEPPPPYTVERAFPQLKFNNPVYLVQEPGTDRWLIGELSGKIYAFTQDTPDAESCDLFLDIGRDLYSFSLHPDYAQNGIVFTFSPRDPDDDRPQDEKKSRVSRYKTTSMHPRRALPDSETVIIEWPAGGHNGGEAIIGPDGYLYIGTGDSTSGSDLKSTGQGVDDLLSVIMRIDVDKPADGRAYSIPPDNPFVDLPNARPEVWAFGFRNPWRMSFDARSGELWVGDVGQDLWEMIWRVQRGGNYGWSVQEGTHPFHPQKPAGPGPILPPVIEHHHSVCRSITGGYVYYGAAFPELDGVYFYGDYEYGMIWGLRSDGSKVTWHETLADTSLRIASFAVSREGDIYALDHPSGEIHKLVRAPDTADNRPFPRRLSDTGLFSDVAAHQTAPGVIPYSVNTPQWVDNGVKERFMAVPGDGTVEFVERSGNARTWGFPDGSVLMETISLEMAAGDPASRRRLETRLLVKQQNHWLGYSYLWNEAQTDAELVATDGRDLQLAVRDEGGERQQTWHIPSRNECMVCHSRAAGFVLGLRTEQINRQHDYGDVTDNQLRTFDHIGLFTKPLDKSPAEYARLPDPYDASEDVNDRARAYLHVNCSVCHVQDGGGNAKIELGYSQDLEKTYLLEEPIHGSFGLGSVAKPEKSGRNATPQPPRPRRAADSEGEGNSGDARIVKPGDPFASVLFYRLSKWGQGRMPHVGSNLHDERGLDLIHDWIKQLPVEEATESSGDGANAPPAERAAERAADGGDALRRLKDSPPAEHARYIEQLLGTTRGAFELAYWTGKQSPSNASRQLAISLGAAHPDPHVRDLFERFLPENQRTKRLGNIIDMASILQMRGDVEAGRRFFFTAAGSQCASCHAVDGQGGNFGPDLKEIGKKLSPPEILDSILQPSRKIDPQYQTHLLETTDGRLYTGIVSERNEKELVLNVFQAGKTAAVRLPSDEVAELVAQDKSLMPDGLLRELTAQQAADLIAFLSSLTGPATEAE